MRFESFESGQGRSDGTGSRVLESGRVRVCLLVRFEVFWWCFRGFLLVRFEDFWWCASRVSNLGRVVAMALALAF